jgi:N-terminal domain of anti-restriction factor ArdC
MKIEQAKQIATKAIEELSQALEAGHSEKLREYLGAMARFHRYSWHNVMLIASQRPDATHVAGFNTWKQLGRFVKKGAKGIMILAPVVYKKSKEDASEEEQTQTAVSFRAVYVFDQVDTDGKPLAELSSAEGNPSGYIEKLKQFIAQRGIALEYSDAIYPAQGQCSADKITLLPGQSAAEEFNTLAHETGHLLLHMADRRAETTKTVRETEAEAVAFVVCEAVGLKAKNSADYIHLYSGSKETLVASLEYIQRTSAEILAAITSTEVN